VPYISDLYIYTSDKFAITKLAWANGDVDFMYYVTSSTT